MREYPIPSFALTCLWIGILASGCASAPPPSSAQKDEAEVMRAQLGEIRTLIQNQNARLDSMETRIGSLGDKMGSTQLSLENLMANRKALAAPIASHPSEGAGTEPQGAVAMDDPEAGFVSDGAIQDFRKGEILLDAQKYPEAILAFSSFVEKYPDHALAGSAQYSIGEAYFKQREYKLAVHEFERVLTSYDRSPHISDTLRDLAEAEDALKMTEQAARHRQLLTSLFPQSPAAAMVSSGAGSASGSGSGSATPHAAAPGSSSSRLDEPPPSAPNAVAAKNTLPTAPLSAAPAPETHEAHEPR